jgi:hypothetical protein
MGPDQGQPAPPPQALIEPLAVERVLPHKQRLERIDEAAALGLRAAIRAAEEGMPRDAGVRDDGQQPERRGASRDADIRSIERRRNPIPGEQRQRDVDDLHDFFFVRSATLA